MQTTSPSPLVPPALLTLREAAKLLNISERSLWQLTADDELRAVRIGRSVRYDIADIQSFILEHKAKACENGEA